MPYIFKVDLLYISKSNICSYKKKNQGTKMEVKCKSLLTFLYYGLMSIRPYLYVSV